MPRRKLPLRSYPPDVAPSVPKLVGRLKNPSGKWGWMYAHDRDAESVAKFCSAWPRLQKKYRKEIAWFVQRYGEGMAMIWLQGIALTIAENIRCLFSQNNVNARRWAALPKEERRFLEGWVADIAHALLKRNDSARVIAQLRTKQHVHCGGDPDANLIPVEKATAGDLAEGTITPATAHKARQKLAKLDESMWGRTDRPLPKRKHHRD